MWPDPQESADLVTFTEETLNGKLYFLCSMFAAELSTFTHVMFTLLLEHIRSNITNYQGL